MGSSFEAKDFQFARQWWGFYNGDIPIYQRHDESFNCGFKGCFVFAKLLKINESDSFRPDKEGKGLLILLCKAMYQIKLGQFKTF